MFASACKGGLFYQLAIVLLLQVAAVADYYFDYFAVVVVDDDIIAENDDYWWEWHCECFATLCAESRRRGGVEEKM